MFAVTPSAAETAHQPQPVSKSMVEQITQRTWQKVMASPDGNSAASSWIHFN
jgi:hypothetical protein